MPYKLCHAQNIKYKPILFWCSFILKFDFKMHLINEFSVIFNEVAYFLLAHSVLYMMNMHKKSRYQCIRHYYKCGYRERKRHVTVTDLRRFTGEHLCSWRLAELARILQHHKIQRQRTFVCTTVIINIIIIINCDVRCSDECILSKVTQCSISSCQ